MPARPIMAPQIHYQSNSEAVTYTADFSSAMQADESIDDITGANAYGVALGIACDDAKILLSAGAIIDSDTIVDGAEIYAGKGVQFIVRAPEASEGSYEIRVTVQTDYGNTRQLICPLTVQN